MRIRTGLVFLVAVFAAGLVQAREDPQPLFRPAVVPADLMARAPDWVGVYLFGNKAGSGSIEYLTVDWNGAKAVQLQFGVALRAKGPGGEVHMQFTGRETFAHASPHALLEYVTTEKQGDKRNETRIVRKGNKYEVTVIQAGQTRTLPARAIDYTLADAVAQTLWIRTQPKKGDVIRRRSMDSDAIGIEVKVDRVKDLSTSLVSGVPTSFYEIETTDEKKGSTSTSRMSADGTLISMMMGPAFEIRREPEAQAKQLDASQDVFVLGIARLNRPLGAHPRRVTRLVLTISGNFEEALNGATGQTATYHPGREVTEIVIGAPVKAKAEPDDVAEALKGTPDYPIEVQAVRDLAKQAVGDAQSQEDKVARLVAFVDQFLEDAHTYDALSVLDLLKTPKGDCTEHAELFVTLARAAGVPARETGGLMYMGDEVLAMGGHAWAEVALGGYWIPVDPTFGEVRADAARITFREAIEQQVRPQFAGKTLIVEEVTLAPEAQDK